MSAEGPDWAQRYDQIYRFVRRRSSSSRAAGSSTSCAAMTVSCSRRTKRSAAAEERAYGRSITGPLLDGLRELDEQQRQVVVLKLFEGRPFAVIACLAGASEEACRSRFSRGLASLRAYLAEKGVTP